jgi:hypothetical protein
MDRDKMSTNMATTDDSCFWLANFLDSSPLKPFGQMNRNLKLGRKHLWKVLCLRLLISSRFINKHGYHLAKRFQRKSCFRNRPIRNKNCPWRPCLLTDQNGMSNSHRGPSIDARKYLWKVLYKDWSFVPDPLTHMAATGNSCFWLVDF